MNSHDLSNLKFLLSLDREAMADWFLKTSYDDIAYAMEIMVHASEDDVRMASSDSIDCSEANSILKKFML